MVDLRIQFLIYHGEIFPKQFWLILEHLKSFGGSIRLAQIRGNHMSIWLYGHGDIL